MNKLWSWVLGLKAKIVDFFKSDAGLVIRKALAEIVETTAPVVTQLVFSLAVKEVGRIDALNISGTEKSNEVKRVILDIVKAKGLEVAENTVDLAIKAAVGALRADQKAIAP